MRLSARRSCWWIRPALPRTIRLFSNTNIGEPRCFRLSRMRSIPGRSEMRIRPDLALVGGLQYGLSGDWDCNVWAVSGPGGAVLIDSGSGVGAELILKNLCADLGIAHPVAVIATHSHTDHAR